MIYLRILTWLHVSRWSWNPTGTVGSVHGGTLGPTPKSPWAAKGSLIEKASAFSAALKHTSYIQRFEWWLDKISKINYRSPVSTNFGDSGLWTVRLWDLQGLTLAMVSCLCPRRHQPSPDKAQEACWKPSLLHPSTFTEVEMMVRHQWWFSSEFAANLGKLFSQNVLAS